MVKQKLRERYVDKNRLDRLLCNLFGNGHFEIEVQHILECFISQFYPCTASKLILRLYLQDEGDFLLITIPQAEPLTKVRLNKSCHKFVSAPFI